MPPELITSLVLLKTSAEISHLRETIETTLDGDHDGVVSDLELMDNYALADDELESYGMDGTSADALRFFSEQYKADTEVELTTDGEYIPTSAPQSLRAASVAAYNTGGLVDAALSIEGVDDPAAVGALQGMEEEWVSLHARASRRFDAETVRRDFAKYSEVLNGSSQSWREMNLDPAAVAGKFTTEDLHNLNDGVLLMKYVSQKKILYDKEQLSFLNFLRGRQRADMSDMTGQRQQTVHDGTCTVVVTWALHMLQLVKNRTINAMLISDHVTLCIPTSLGPVYLDPAAGQGFQPPSYYESRAPEETVRRARENPVEPWQILSAVYGNIAAAYDNAGRSAVGKNYYEAALEIYSDDVTNNSNYGRWLRSHADNYRAREYFNRALAINPDYEVAKTALNN